MGLGSATHFDLDIGQNAPTSKTYILHISTLLFDRYTNPLNSYYKLASDLKDNLGCSYLDAVIISGDIAKNSTQKEYDAAKQFLKNLCKDFQFNPDQLVIVPGDHDLNLRLAQDAYHVKRLKNYKGPLDEQGNPDKNYAIYDGGTYVEVQSQEKYKQRFKNFCDFYEAIKGKPYPLEYEQQGILYHFPKHNLLILGLNSAWQLDHHYTTRVSVCRDALSNALNKIRQNPEIYQNCLKFAVWHHPLDMLDKTTRIINLSFMQSLAQAGFCVSFHGHVHKADVREYRPEPVSVGGAKIHIVCAGTFGAPTKEWQPGYPLQYNLLKLIENKLIVETRCRRELDGEWEPDAIWKSAPQKDALPRYEITLPEIANTRYNPKQVESDYSTSQTEHTTTQSQNVSPIKDKEQKVKSEPQQDTQFDNSFTEYRKRLEEPVKTIPESTEQRSTKSTLPKKRVLIIAVCPRDTPRLRLEEEVREIREALQKSKKFRFVVEVKWAARIEDLRESLLEFEPHIVHFCGHAAGVDGLVFEDHEGQAHLVNPEALTTLFTLVSNQIEGVIECVVLSACYTLVQADAMIPYIGCIVGMSNAVGDRAAIEFSKGFYQALSNGKTLDSSFALGCNAIQTSGIPENLTPILKKSNLFSGPLRIDNEADSSHHQDYLQADERILVLVANPRDIPRMRLDEEVREIDAALKQAREGGKVELEHRSAARFKDLKEALFKFKPTIIHFSGYGQEDKLCFEDETGNANFVKAQPLANLLKLFANQVKCVLLNASYSQVIAQEIANYIDYTIGYPKDISDQHCINFSIGFYSALGWGRSCEEAYKLGCIELQRDEISENEFPTLNRKRD